MLDTNPQLRAASSDVVAFKLEDQDFCIDIGSVREIRGWTETTVLPHAQDYVKGVINLRGSVVAVVDLSARLGLGITKPTARHVIIIAIVGKQTVGILADVVSDILTVPQSSLKPVPEIAADTARDFITGVITFDDGRIIRKIDLDRVLPHPERATP